MDLRHLDARAEPCGRFTAFSQPHTYKKCYAKILKGALRHLPKRTFWRTVRIDTLAALKMLHNLPQTWPRQCGKLNMDSKRQSAALPYVSLPGRANCAEVLLLTSRDTGRWIIPKGWLEKNLLEHMVAEHEAFEEAGLRGRIGLDPIGQYSYVKRMGDRADISCEVSVYPLEVQFQYLDWPERAQRSFSWFSPEDAASRVKEDELAVLLRDFRPSG